MNRFQNAWVVVVASLSLSLMACVSDDDGSSGTVPDSGSTVLVDATPITPPDANVRTIDAAVSTADSGISIGLACTLDEVEPIISCAAEHCLEDLGTDNISGCLLINCGLLVLGLSSECSSCMLSALADTSSALDACVTGLSDVPEF